MTEPQSKPKVFLSYAWGSEEYDNRVIELAENLVRNGIEVVFDKWHLEEGHNALAFMERTVNDPSVTHVLILCEPRYAAKANDRQGGAGTETLIISPQVYRDAEQVKFIPVIMERNEDGSVAVPTYMDGRKYIDLSIAETEDDSFTRLVRRLWGKPELVPPPLGERPAYLDETRPQLLTGNSLNQYKDAVRRGRPQTTGYLSTYLQHLLDAYRAEMIAPDVDPQQHTTIRDESIERFLPYRDEFVEAVRFIADFVEDGPTFDRLHRFFEDLANFRYQAEGQSENITDNLGFISRELFLYAVAILLNVGRFEALDRMLRPFLISTGRASSGVLRSISILDPDFPRFRANRDRFRDPIVFLLKRRATIADLPYVRLAEAEVFLALRTYFEPIADLFWGKMVWASLGAGAEWNHDQLPLAERLKEPQFRDRFLLGLGLHSTSELATRLTAEVDAKPYSHPLQWLNAQNVATLLGVPGSVTAQ
jgi:hypothetical protein